MQQVKSKQIKSKSELLNQIGNQGGKDSGDEGWQDEIDPKTGLTYGELENMDFFEILELMKNKR